MIRKRLLAFVGPAIAAFAGPGLAHTPPPDAKPSPDVAWLVIGVRPANTRLEIDEPWMEKGSIWNFHYDLNAYRPEDGFILVKARPGAPYGIAASSVMWGKTIFGFRYKFCGKVPTFQAKGGKVVYITSIAYRGEDVWRGPLINMDESATFSEDLEGARAFLKAHYPGLSDSLEQGRYEMTPVAQQC